MKRTAACLALCLGFVLGASAAPPGFITDFAQAKRQAGATGKYIFIYFNLKG